MYKLFSIFTANQNKISVPINRPEKFEAWSRHYTRVNYLKSFDTAFIAYYMMGFDSF